MYIYTDFQGLFLKTRENKSHKNSFCFRAIFDGIWPFFAVAHGGAIDPYVAIAHRGSKDPFLAPPVAQNSVGGSVDPTPP